MLTRDEAIQRLTDRLSAGELAEALLNASAIIACNASIDAKEDTGVRAATRALSRPMIHADLPTPLQDLQHYAYWTAVRRGA